VIVAWSFGQNALRDDLDRSERIIFGDMPHGAADVATIVVDLRDRRGRVNRPRRGILAQRAGHTAPLIANLADEHPMTEEWTPGPKHTPRESRAGKVIFRVAKGTDIRYVEFRHHEGVGVEVQLFENGELFRGRMFETEWLARTEATRQREAFEALGWKVR